jgi:hypothetical protein
LTSKKTYLYQASATTAIITDVDAAGAKMTAEENAKENDAKKKAEEQCHEFDQKYTIIGHKFIDYEKVVRFTFGSFNFDRYRFGRFSF